MMRSSLEQLSYEKRQLALDYLNEKAEATTENERQSVKKPKAHRI